MTQSLPAYRLKAERAKSHIQDLTTRIHAFYATDPYTVTVEDDIEAHQRVWKLKLRNQIPHEWSTIIGDAIHNIRASLDLLMCSVVRHCDPARQSIKHVHFTIRETEQEFKSALPENVKGASPEAIKLIHELKPYKGGNEALWRIHKLDILDKHQAIIPVGSALIGVGIHELVNANLPPIRIGSGGENIPNDIGPLFITAGDQMFPLQDGAELFRATLDMKLPDNDKIQFRTDISFGEGQIIDGEPVVPALSQLVDVVESIFDIFERHVLNQPIAK